MNAFFLNLIKIISLSDIILKMLIIILHIVIKKDLVLDVKISMVYLLINLLKKDQQINVILLLMNNYVHKRILKFNI